MGALDYLVQLCQHKHRASASPAEGEAAKDLSTWLTGLGYRVSVNSFLAPRDTIYLGSAMILVGFVSAAGVAGAFSPAAGLLLCLILLVPLVGEMLGSSRFDFDLILPRYPSRNIVARLGSKDAAQRLVISAHYDTQRASLLFHPKFVTKLQGYFYLIYAGLLLIPVGIALDWAWPGAPWVRLILVIGGALSTLNAIFMVVCRLTGRYINGANDNGSGVALALSLAAHLHQNPPVNTEVIILLTGSEEVGTRGMKAFVRTANLPIESTLFINLDNLGAGMLHHLTGEGMLVYRPYAERLVAAARAGSLPRRNLLLPTDGLIPARAGYQTITFIAFDHQGALPHYHWYTDTLAKIDRAALAQTERYLINYVQEVVGP